MKLLTDEGKTTREHAEVWDEVLEEGQWNVAQGIDTLNGHDLERTKKNFGTVYFVAKVEPLTVKYGQILLLEERQGVDVGDAYKNTNTGEFIDYISDFGRWVET